MCLFATKRTSAGVWTMMGPEQYSNTTREIVGCFNSSYEEKRGENENRCQEDEKIHRRSAEDQAPGQTPGMASTRQRLRGTADSSMCGSNSSTEIGHFAGKHTITIQMYIFPSRARFHQSQPKNLCPQAHDMHVNKPRDTEDPHSTHDKRMTHYHRDQKQESSALCMCL